MRRKIQKKTGDDWVDVELEDLVIGDRFRMFEPDGTMVFDAMGGAEFVASSAPYHNYHFGSMAIRVE